MATRDLTAAMLTAIAQKAVRFGILYHGEFVADSATEDLRLWTGVGDLSWNGYTWTGAGNLLGISEITETVDLTAKGFQVSLSGIQVTDIARALAGGQKNRPGTLWLALFDTAWSVLADPYQLAKGRFDRIEFSDEAVSCAIAALYESVLLMLRQPRFRRYTTLDQKRDYASDTGFNQVPGLVNLQFQWGG